MKHLAKSRATDREAQLVALQESIDRISQFVQAQGMLAQDPAAAVTLCQQLLQQAPEQVVRACAAAAPSHSPSPACTGPRAALVQLRCLSLPHC